MSNKDRIFAYVEQHGSITADIAERELGIRRLAARIYEMQEGQRAMKVLGYTEEGCCIYGADYFERTGWARSSAIRQIVHNGRDLARTADVLLRLSKAFEKAAIQEEQQEVA